MAEVRGGSARVRLIREGLLGAEEGAGGYSRAQEPA